jgi:hypothetical protein
MLHWNRVTARSIEPRIASRYSSRDGSTCAIDGDGVQAVRSRCPSLSHSPQEMQVRLGTCTKGPLFLESNLIPTTLSPQPLPALHHKTSALDVSAGRLAMCMAAHRRVTSWSYRLPLVILTNLP